MRNVSEIPLKTKVYQLRHELRWERKGLNPLLYAIDVRNSQSHRSLAVDGDLIREMEERLRKAGAWTSYGRPDYEKAVSVMGADAWNRYLYQAWLDRQPFGEVTEAIRRLSEAIASSVRVLGPAPTSPAP